MPLKFKRTAKPARKVPLWEGPSGVGPQGGITQGMLGRFLSCAERFRLQVIEGWKTADSFSPTMDFGNMHHLCEEYHARNEPWEKPLKDYAIGLCRKYPMQQEQVQHWYELCRHEFPEYVEYWAYHPDVTSRKPLLQECVFSVDYPLASSRTVRLRGKWDGVDLVGSGKQAGIYLFETKTKSSINEGKLVGQLANDLQTMVYLAAMHQQKENAVTIFEAHPILGVRYNAIRRSAHKSLDSFAKKLAEDKAAERLGEWFARWNVRITTGDLARFRQECLDPVLENLCDDYEWWEYCYKDQGNVYDYQARAKIFPKHRRRHFRTPYCYSPIMEGGSGDLDALLNEGSTVGLERATTLFKELE